MREPFRSCTEAEAPAQWMQQSLGCLIGRQFARQGRFLITECRSAEELRDVRYRFGQALADGVTASCYVTLAAPPEITNPSAPIRTIVEYVRDTYFPGGSGDELQRAIPDVDGVTYNLTYRLRCPVTGEMVNYTDFDQVAFYPQAINEEDPLYDPSMYAPSLSLNITSDVYGFSLITREAAVRLGYDVERLGDLSPQERSGIYSRALKSFQNLAIGTIRFYGEITNSAILDPIHVTPENLYYISQHDESALVETAKCPFVNEMPSRYAPRIIEAWESYFASGEKISMGQVYRPAAIEASSLRPE